MCLGLAPRRGGPGGQVRIGTPRGKARGSPGCKARIGTPTGGPPRPRVPNQDWHPEGGAQGARGTKPGLAPRRGGPRRGANPGLAPWAPLGPPRRGSLGWFSKPPQRGSPGWGVSKHHAHEFFGQLFALSNTDTRLCPLGDPMCPLEKRLCPLAGQSVPIRQKWECPK